MLQHKYAKSIKRVALKLSVIKEFLGLTLIDMFVNDRSRRV